MNDPVTYVSLVAQIQFEIFQSLLAEGEAGIDHISFSFSLSSSPFLSSNAVCRVHRAVIIYSENYISPVAAKFIFNIDVNYEYSIFEMAQVGECERAGRRRRAVKTMFFDVFAGSLVV